MLSYGFQKENVHIRISTYLALIVILVVSIVAAHYALGPALKGATVGVHVGDSFTYSITGNINFAK